MDVLVLMDIVVVVGVGVRVDAGVPGRIRVNICSTIHQTRFEVDVHMQMGVQLRISSDE